MMRPSTRTGRSHTPSKAAGRSWSRPVPAPPRPDVLLDLGARGLENLNALIRGPLELRAGMRAVMGTSFGRVPSTPLPGALRVSRRAGVWGQCMCDGVCVLQGYPRCRAV